LGEKMPDRDPTLPLISVGQVSNFEVHMKIEDIPCCEDLKNKNRVHLFNIFTPLAD
jgi:hypothetical protein